MTALDIYQTYADIDADLGEDTPIYDSANDMLIARKYLSMAWLDEAEHILRDIIVKEQANAEAHYLLGKIYASRGEADKAVLSFKQAIRWDISNAEYRAALGYAYATAGEVILAALAFIKSLILRHDPEIEAALKAFLKLDKNTPPASADAWVDMLVAANRAFDARENDKAEQLYREVAKFHPHCPSIKERLLNLERQRKHPGQICQKPWENARLRPDGTVEVCCLAQVRIGDVRKKDLKEIWNDEKVQDLRKSILDGSYRHCPHHTCNALRMGQFPSADKVKLPSVKESVKTQRLTVERPDIWMTMVYDKTCNLSCPSCRTEKVVLQGREFNEAKAVHDYIKNKCLSSLSRMTVCGQGDPFASRLYRDLLYNIDGADYPNLSIHLFTNGLLLNERAWDRMYRVRDKIDHINISIDAATDATYAKLRRGGQMEHLRPNLEFVAGLRRAGKIKTLQFNFVVQSANYREMPAFVRMAESYAADLANFQRMRGAVEASNGEVFTAEHPNFSDFLDVLETPEMGETIVRIPWADESLVVGGRKPRFNAGPNARSITDDDEDGILDFG